MDRAAIEPNRTESQVRSRKLELGSWKSEVGSWKSEVGNQKLEVRSGKWEVGSGKWEILSRKSEVGSRKWEVRSGRSEGLAIQNGFLLSMGELDMTEVFMKTRLNGKDKNKIKIKHTTIMSRCSCLR